MSIVFQDSLFDAQWLRAASHASSGAAEIGECLAAASQIRELDAESWFKAWNDLGERITASPAISGDNLIYRTDSHVYCIGP